MEAAPSAGPPLRWSSIAAVSLACVPAFWLIHLLFLEWMSRGRTNLGALNHRFLVPLHAEWDPQWSPWAIPAVIAVLVFLAWIVPAILKARTRGVMGLGIASYLVLTTSVSMVDGMQRRGAETLAPIVLPYARTHLEYYGDVPLVEKVGGPRNFVSRYAKPRLFEQLSLHARTHPPGGILFLWGVGRSFGWGLWPAALATIAVGSLASVLIFLIARELYGGEAARFALILFLLATNVITYGATSMDSVFAVFPMAALLLFLRSQRDTNGWIGCVTWGGLAGLALAMGSFLTYAVLFLPVFYLVLLTRPGRDRFQPGRMILGHAAGLVAFALFYLALWAWAQYDPFEAVRASFARDATMVGTGHESWLKYGVISAANLTAFAFGFGLPTLAVWLREIAIRPRRALGDPFARAFVWTCLLLTFSTLFTLELERIWLFTSPFVLAPAGKWLSAATHTEGESQILPRFAAALGINLLLAESLLKIPW